MTDAKEYQPLSVGSVPAYLAKIPAVREVLGDLNNITCAEVGDGNLNLVFDVRSKENGRGSVIIKQALPYLRCAGEGWPLGRQRMLFESKALEIENELCPGLVPKLYHYDEPMSLVVMENLNKHRIMRKGLIEGVKYPKFAADLAHFMAQTLYKTSDFYLPSAEKKQLVEFFARNTELCKITEDFVFTNPYMDSPDNKWNPEIDALAQAVRRNARLKLEIAELKLGFLNHAQALVHGDLHSGSVMLNLEDTRIIDPEFAFFGPMGFDVGALLGNLVLAFCSHEIHSRDQKKREEYQGWILETIKTTWEMFEEEFLQLWRTENKGEATRPEFFAQCGGEETLEVYRRSFMRQLLQDTAGYGGCKMMRRQLGIAHVEDIQSIQDPKERAVAEGLALAIGARFVLERRQINSIDDFLAVVKTTPRV